MEKILILKELCLSLERDLNWKVEDDHKRTVEFFSGLKPCDYYLPQMHIGTTNSIPVDVKMAWFVEVGVDGKVIFRESYVLLKDNDDLQKIEEIVANKVLCSIFSFGVMSSKELIDETE